MSPSIAPIMDIYFTFDQFTPVYADGSVALFRGVCLICMISLLFIIFMLRVIVTDVKKVYNHITK